MHSICPRLIRMIAAQNNHVIQERLMKLYMSLPNDTWKHLIARLKANINLLNNPNEIEVLVNLLKINIAACSSSGSAFQFQLTIIYHDLLSLYGVIGNLIIKTIASQGLAATKTPEVRGWRTVKIEILKLLDIYVQSTNNVDTVNNLFGSFWEAVFTDYNQNVDSARDAEALNFIASITNKLQKHVIILIPTILNGIFEPTFNMITKGFSEFPERRTGFYQLLSAVTKHCFQALLKLPPQIFKLFIDTARPDYRNTL